MIAYKIMIFIEFILPNENNLTNKIIVSMFLHQLLLHIDIDGVSSFLFLSIAVNVIEFKQTGSLIVNKK